MDEVAIIRISKVRRKSGKEAIKFFFKKNSIIAGFIKPVKTYKL